jgi:dTDP-4-amino-4,6-dideoxygalactose transaminase
MYYLLLPDLGRRQQLIAGLEQRGIHAVFHYVPLHSAEAGRRYGRTASAMPVTDDVAERLVRLPLWPAMTEDEVDRVIAAVHDCVSRSHAAVG